MFILYNGTNVHAMAHINNLALKAMRHPSKKNKALVQSPQDVKWLRPGWNEFPNEVWEQNKDHPQIKYMIKNGMIELLDYTAKLKVRTPSGKLKVITKKIGTDDNPIKLRHFDEVTAIKVVKKTFDRDMLQRWEDEETRHKVKKVLRKQIEPLLNKSEDEDDDDYEDTE